MIFKIILFILISLKPSLCSWVVDGMSQDSIFISDYCPEMKHCQEGTHVMCMYYDESSPRGPLCENFVETTITPEIIDVILEIINAAKSRVATGVERGEDDVLLPRGYGMMRLKWDRELAIFAQVLANQCFLSKNDECRATNRFPNPSQSISMINFHYPDWDFFTNNANQTEPGLTEEKLLYGITRSLGSWVPERKSVSKEHILSYPSPQSLSAVERVYMNSIRGAATHMGCGISAFTKHNFAENQRNDVVNILEVICNFSDSPQVSQPVYMTDPPIPGTGFTDECGCPTGYKETEGCLCEEDLDYVKPTTSTEPAYYQPRYKNKKLREILVSIPYVTGPTVIDSTKGPSGDLESQVVFKARDFFDHIQNPIFKTRTQQKQYAFLPVFKIKTSPNEPIYERSRTDERPSLSRYDNSTYLTSNRVLKYASTSDENYERSNPKPTKKHPNNRFHHIENKDSNKEVNDEFVTVIRRTRPGRVSKVEESAENSIEEMENAENVDHHPSSHRRGYNDKANTNINIIKKTNDHNLMNLLDILEHKVKNIDMNFKEKEIFDAKMRKIYKAVSNKQKQMQQTRQIQQTKQKNKQSVPVKSDDIETEFKELKNLLKLKSQHISDHESFHSNRRVGGTENTAKDERKAIKNVHRQNNKKDNDIIDDKLIEILKQKNNKMIAESDIKFKNDINSRQSYMDRHLKNNNERKSYDVVTPNNDFEQIDYDDERDYTSVLVPRNQETFYKYDHSDNDLPDTDDRKVFKLNNVHSNTDVFEYSQRVPHTPKFEQDHIIGNRRMSNNHKINKSTKPSGRRIFSYFEDPDDHQDTRTFRRMEDYNLEQPLRRFQLNQINTQWKSKIHQLTNPHYLSDRAS